MWRPASQQPVVYAVIAVSVALSLLVSIKGRDRRKTRLDRKSRRKAGDKAMQAAYQQASQLTPAEVDALVATAQQLAARGKGILAADESTSTIGKRLIAAGLPNDAETRRAYRELLISHPQMGECLSGVIMFEETLRQRHSNGQLLSDVLSSKGILTGIKSDLGLRPLSFSPDETETNGLDDLLERSKEFYRQGARFAKWRAVVRIDAEKKLPTRRAMGINARQLALYAVITQAAGMVPIVEPEVLIEGDHTAERFAEVNEQMLGLVFAALADAHVCMEGMLLKPQMMMAGVQASNKPTAEKLVELTLRTLRRRVPPAVPGIMFLSGGQTEKEATHHLNLINTVAAADASRHPWTLSFSFGRSLQASVLEVWKGQEANRSAAIDMAYMLARANAQAQTGSYKGPHPSIIEAANLHDANRGWRPS